MFRRFIVFLLRKFEGPKKQRPSVNDLKKTDQYRERFGRKTVLGRSVHYSDLPLLPELFPKIRLTKKPANEEFLSIRKDLVDAVFEVIRGHYQYVIGLPGLSKREDLHKVLEHVLREFIRFFWDMPASKDNHHAEEFGMLIHSLNVACAHAEQAAENKRLWASSGLDSERMHKEQGYLILAYFCAALFHDAHKIFDYDLVCVGEHGVLVRFVPALGGLLNFKLVHPGSYRVEWDHLPNDTFFHNVSLLFTFVPKDFLFNKECPEVFQSILAKMIEFKEGQDPIDKANAHEAMNDRDPAARMYMAILDCIRENLELKPKTLGLYKVSDDWYAFDFEMFPMSIVNAEPRLFRHPRIVLLFLDSLGVLAHKIIDWVPRHSEQFTCSFSFSSGDTFRMKNVSLGFIRKEYIQAVLKSFVLEVRRHIEFPVVKIDGKRLHKESLVYLLKPALPEDSFILDDPVVAQPSQAAPALPSTPEEITPAASDMPSMDMPGISSPVSTAQSTATDEASEPPSAPSEEEHLENMQEDPDELPGDDLGEEIESEGNDGPDVQAKDAEGEEEPGVSEKQVDELHPPLQNDSDSEPFQQDTNSGWGEDADLIDAAGEPVSGLQVKYIFDVDGKTKLNGRALLNRIEAYINDTLLNSPDPECFAFYTVPEGAHPQSGLLEVKIPEIFKAIINSPEMFQGENCDITQTKMISVLNYANLLVNSDSALKKLTYYSPQDAGNIAPMKTTQHLFITIKNRGLLSEIRSLREYIKMRVVK
ncbi:MAG: TraI domain-containing protein [Proteobacteria bacterium]|nr:TraI domain-containing protein [Pseudomonadota bacterium]